MNRDEVLRMYGLALSVVGEPDIAGDLFMDAKDEADLLRRANWWRFQQGMPPVQVGEAVPTLTPDQVEHALHLAGRAGARRRAKFALTAGGGGTLLLALIGAAVVSTSPIEIQKYFYWMHPTMAVLLICASVVLIRRGADPGARVMLGWGIMYGLTGAWNRWLLRLFATGQYLSPDHPALKVNNFMTMLHWVLMVATAAYVTWRLWPSNQGVPARKESTDV